MLTPSLTHPLSLLPLAATAIAVHAADPVPSPSATAGEDPAYRLVWSDEFDAAGAPDPAVWNFEHGFQRNGEAQWYQESNAFCENGLLVIEARQERIRNDRFDPSATGGSAWKRTREWAEFTSASLTTRGKREFQYGRLEVRAKIPTGGGAWPAIWTMGTSMEWPSCGEIDIMEYYRVRGEPSLFANVCWGTDEQWKGRWNTGRLPFQQFLDKDPQWAEKFHVWRMDWDESRIAIYLDGERLNEQSLEKTVNGSLGGHRNPFRQPHYLLLNLAIGGHNGGEPDPAAFPMRYEIDYVRLYEPIAPAAAPGQ